MSDLLRRLEAMTEQHLEAVARLRSLLPEVAAAAERLARCLGQGGRVFSCGNGGSAADAQHLAAELVGRFGVDRRALPAMSLSTDTSALTAIANDYGYDQVFARQLEALARPGDTLVVISTSGRSANVVEAVRVVKERGVATLGLLGRDGGTPAPLVDVAVIAACDETARIQECHILIGHLLCAAIEAQITGG